MANCLRKNMAVRYLVVKLQEMLDFAHNLRQPVCFHLDEDESQAITDAELPELDHGKKGERPLRDEYDHLLHIFNQELIGEQAILQRKTQNLRQQFYEVLQKDYPGWTEDTAFVLYYLFKERADFNNATIQLNTVYAILGCMGCDYEETRVIELLKKNNKMKDEPIHFNDFLKIIYDYEPKAGDEGLRGPAKAAAMWGKNCAFAANVSIGQQLEYGIY